MKTIFSVCWPDLSDLSTDREPQARNNNIASFRVRVLTSPFIIYFEYFTFVYFLSERVDVFGKFLLPFHIQFTLMEIDRDL